MEAQAKDAASQVYTTRKDCRACHSEALVLALDLGNQYLPRFEFDVDLELPRSPLMLVRCASCGLLQLLHTVSPDLLFREFWYRTSINQTMRDAMKDLVLDATRYHKAGTWLDIGANDGYLLSQVPEEFVRVGVEPAKNLTPLLEEHCDEVIADYFKGSKDPCDIITSAAMFYDLDDPGSFLDAIRNSLSADGVWINQLNDAPTMVKSNAFDSICHEHLCYYDVPTLAQLYKRHGLSVVEVTHNRVNGGSIRVIATRGLNHYADLLGHGSVTGEDAQAFAKRVLRWKSRMADLLGGIRHQGPLYGYGASTKGTVLLQYLGETAMLAVADRNPNKVGRTMAGSWVPIVDEATFRKARPEYVLVLPWSRDFVSEFLDREKELTQAGTTFVCPLPNIEVII